MDLSILFGICAVVVTLTLLVVSISVIRTLRRTQRSLEYLEHKAELLEPTILELQGALKEWREVGEQVSEGVTSVRRVASRVESVGGKALDAGNFLFGGGTLGRAFAVFRAVQAGARFFFRRASGDESRNGREQAGDGSPGVPPAPSRIERGEEAHVQSE